MGLIETLELFAAGLALIGLALWRERRPRRSLDPPLVPNRPILFVGCLIFVLSGIHLTTFVR